MGGHTNRILPEFTNFQQVPLDLTLQQMYTPHWFEYSVMLRLKAVFKVMELDCQNT